MEQKRREFLKVAGGAAVLGLTARNDRVLAAPSPNDRINVGFIGVGGRCHVFSNSATSRSTCPVVTTISSGGLVVSGSLTNSNQTKIKAPRSRKCTSGSLRRRRMSTAAPC